jgi:hypothetical protein
VPFVCLVERLQDHGPCIFIERHADIRERRCFELQADQGGDESGGFVWGVRHHRADLPALAHSCQAPDLPGNSPATASRVAAHKAIGIAFQVRGICHPDPPEQIVAHLDGTIDQRSKLDNEISS